MTTTTTESKEPVTAAPPAVLPIRSISYGAGHQSTALLVLAAHRRIDFELFLMSNVGDDSEHPASLEYARYIATPYGKHHGLEVRILDRQTRDGSPETLYGRLTKEGSRSLPIPVRMSNGAPGNRSCTADFKIRVIAKELKRLGAHAGIRCRAHKAEDLAATRALAAGPAVEGTKPVRVDEGARVDCSDCTPPNLATIGIGISLDEIHRANSRRAEPHERVVYPLIGMGEETGLKMRRDDCTRLIAEEPLPAPVAELVRAAVAEGLITHADTIRQLERSDYSLLPVPPKSSCYFCPFHRPTTWQDMRRNEPELFEKAAQLEDLLNDRRVMLKKDPVFLTRFAIPLREAISDGDGVLFELGDDGGCDSGWCMT